MTCRSGAASFFSIGFGGAPRFRDEKPKPPEAPNLCAPNPGEGGGFDKVFVFSGENPGDIGGRDSSSGASPGDGGGLDNDGGTRLGDRGGFDSLRGANPGDGGGRGSELIAGVNPKNPGDGGGRGIEFIVGANPKSPGDGGG